MTLERQVDPPPPTVAATAGRVALSFLAGATAVAIAFVARPRGAAPPPPPTPAAPPHITVMAPPPIVVSLETVVEAPRPAPSFTDGLDCPVLPSGEAPIGKRISPATVDRNEPQATVKTAAKAPVLAVHAGSGVWISDDDGRTWSRAFAGHSVDGVAVAPDGTVYAREGTKLGVRAPGAKIVWRPIIDGCDEDARCEIAVGALGSEVFAFIDDRIRVSADRGKTWKDATNKNTAWQARDGAEIYAFRGALYQVAHYQDMCGIDDYHTYRIDAQHRVAYDVFHNYDNDDDEPVLEPSTDVDSVWTWADRCRVAGDELGRCQKRQADRHRMLEAAMLSPREGARALALYRGALIELCTGGVRQVYREFPFDHLDAVDASGRALVMNGGELLRWSPQTGWRKLRAFEAPPVDQEGA